jgi:uridylate kinase
VVNRSWANSNTVLIQRLNDYAVQIGHAVQAGVEVAIVIGGGNIFRGMSGRHQGIRPRKRRSDGNAGNCH